MTIKDFMTQFVKDLNFRAVLDWAEILEIPCPVKDWFDKEDELRAKVTEAILKVGKNV